MMNSTGKEMAQMLSDFANCMSNREREEEFMDELIYGTHRTLQQSVFKIFVGCIKRWADMGNKNMYDLRNEDTVKICQDIVKNVEKLDWIRFI